MNTATVENLVVEVRQTYPVSRERLYAAWTNPAEVSKWFAPEDAPARDVKMDVRPGGKYSIVATAEECGCAAVGEFIEVMPPTRLVYSWRQRNKAEWDGVESIVTVEFNEVPGGAELHLVHRGFPSEENRDAHEGGWTVLFGKLGRMLEA